MGVWCDGRANGRIRRRSRSRRRRRARLRRALLGAPGGRLAAAGDRRVGRLPRLAGARPPAQRRRPGPGAERPGASVGTPTVPCGRSPPFRSRPARPGRQRPTRAGSSGGVRRSPATTSTPSAQIAVAIDELARHAFPTLLRTDLASLVPTGGGLDLARLAAVSTDLTGAHESVQRTRQNLAAVPADSLVSQIRQALSDLRDEIDRLASLTRLPTRAPACCRRCSARTAHAATCSSRRTSPSCAPPAACSARTR